MHVSWLIVMSEFDVTTVRFRSNHTSGSLGTDLHQWAVAPPTDFL